MNKLACIIDKNNFYVDFVAVNEKGGILFYELKPGESLVNADPPSVACETDGKKVLLCDEMMLKPKWSKTKKQWLESATAPEVEAARVVIA